MRALPFAPTAQRYAVDSVSDKVSYTSDKDKERCEIMSANLERIIEEIVALSEHDKALLAARLREVLRLEPEDWARLKLAEAAFSFWDNESDTDYDRL